MLVSVCHYEIIQKYTIPLDNVISNELSHLTETNVVFKSREDTEKEVDNLINAMHKCSENIKQEKVKSGEKPYFIKNQMFIVN